MTLTHFHDRGVFYEASQRVAYFQVVLEARPWNQCLAIGVHHGQRHVVLVSQLFLCLAPRNENWFQILARFDLLPVDNVGDLSPDLEFEFLDLIVALGVVCVHDDGN